MDELEPGVPAPPRRSGPAAGLCGACRHSRVIRTTRGTVFRLCERSTTDVRYPRYPVLPVISCPGFETRDVG
jgi:hypothetical protein